MSWIGGKPSLLRLSLQLRMCTQIPPALYLVALFSLLAWKLQSFDMASCREIFIAISIIALVVVVNGKDEMADKLRGLPRGGQFDRSKRSIAANFDDAHCMANFEQRDNTIIRTEVSSTL